MPISEFRSRALLTHAPAERKAFAVAWLKKKIDHRSIAQLKAIVANRPTWPGSTGGAQVTATPAPTRKYEPPLK